MSKQQLKDGKQSEEEKTFEVKIAKEDIEIVIKEVSLLSEELTLHIDIEGITIRLMDPSHVALIDVSLPNTMFEKYEVQNEFDVGVRADELSKMIKMFDKDSRITFTYTADNLLILSNRTDKYTLRTIEANKNDTPLPKIPYDAKVEYGPNQDYNTKDFIKTLDKIKILSDYVTFDTTNSRTILSGKGDIGEAQTTLERGQVTIDVKQDSIGTYSLEYIIPFVKLVKDYSLAIEYSSSKPLRIEAKIANVGRLHFYLAPRVES